MTGDEADADWQDGLVEWGIADAEEYYGKRIRETTNRRRSNAPARPARQPQARCRQHVVRRVPNVNVNGPAQEGPDQEPHI